MKHIISSLLFLFISGIILAQNTVSFEVKEESGESLIGASVVVKGTTNGTITNTEGFAKFENLLSDFNFHSVSEANQIVDWENALTVNL